jgi:hypothetical protein
VKPTSVTPRFSRWLRVPVSASNNPARLRQTAHVLQRIVTSAETDANAALDKMLRRVGKNSMRLSARRRASSPGSERVSEKVWSWLIRIGAQIAAVAVGFRAAEEPFEIPVEVLWTESVQPMLHDNGFARGLLIGNTNA